MSEPLKEILLDAVNNKDNIRQAAEEGAADQRKLMSTPLEVIQKNEEKFADKLLHPREYIRTINNDNTLALLQALLQALHDELEEREMEVEVALGNPEAMAALSGYNDSIQDQQDNLQALMDKIRV